MKNLITILCCFICTQIANAQSHTKKPAGTVKAAPAKENYIAQEITKNGTGDHGIFYDTLANKIKSADPINAAGKQYQDINVTLGAGDVIKTNLVLNNGYEIPTLSLLNTVNGHLILVKAFIDTSSSYAFKLSYKSSEAGIYTLRVTGKKRVPKNKDEKQYYYENNASYNLNCIIATQTSGLAGDNPTICDQVQFLLRQRLTDYMQITGAIADTTMDVLDKKKIGFINYVSTFTIDKNSKAKIAIDPGGTYIAFDQSLFYNNNADAAQAQRYFIENFKTCLGSDWKGEVDPQDANWYKFKKGRHQNISIILYPEYKYVQILM
jgi:hypothetical protein